MREIKANCRDGFFRLAQKRGKVWYTLQRAEFEREILGPVFESEEKARAWVEEAHADNCDCKALYRPVMGLTT